MKLRFIFFLSIIFLITFFIYHKNIFASGEATIDKSPYLENINTDCMTSEESTALKIRIMQDQIAIASRNCTDTEKDLFNKINKKFQKIFDANNVLLEVFFQKFASDNPINAMNNFITENANSASLKSIYNKKVFCQKQNFTMEQLLKSDSNKIGYIANKNITQEISNPKKCESD